MVRARFASVAQAFPSRILRNVDLEKMVDTSDSWIVERTGIKERRILGEEFASSDLAAEAATKACASANIDPKEIEAIVVCTVTPDMPMPATAVFVQQKIGAGHCAAFDISAACAGFVFGVGIADSFIRSTLYRKVLVIGVEVLSRAIDWTDRNTCVLFGDGAGAAILTATEAGDDEDGGILDIELKSDGAQACHLLIPGGGSAKPFSHEMLKSRDNYLRMNGRQVFTHAVKNMSEACRAVLKRNDKSPDDIDLVIAHQANIRILEGVSQRVGIPMDRFVRNIERYGNTSSASIPAAMAEAVMDGRCKRGDLVLLTGLGAGLSWGSALVRW